MARAESRIRVRVLVRSRPAALLAAIREYATEREGRPWSIKRRRPLVLRHASPRAANVSYTFSRDDADIELRVAGKSARLALAYAVTLLANTRFADHIQRFEVELPA